MDMTTVLEEVDSWSPEDRLRLVETLWGRLLDEGVALEPTEAQKAELDRRLQALQANPDDVVSWEEVQEYVRRQR